MRTRSLVVLAAVLAAPSAAFAHRLLVVVKPDETGLVVEVTYDSGDPGEAGTKVTLTDRAGSVVAAGATDGEGRYRFPRPPSGHYTLSADDGAGHREAIPVVIADQTFTTGSSGRNRWVMSAVGLTAIAGGTWLAWRLLRRRREL
jgi:hypothetical protein